MENISNSSSPSWSDSSSLSLLDGSCFGTAYDIATSVAVVTIFLLFLLPLYVRVLHLALVRRARPVASATNSDLFTFHLVVMELLVCVSLVLYLIGLCADSPSLISFSQCMYVVGDLGKPLFHCCTCVERYLAVVHPIRYLGLKGGGACWVWHVATGCVWLFSSVCIGFFYWSPGTYFFALDFIIFIISLLIITFCCLSVLRALIRPGPGDGGGNRKKVDQSKRRAFWTIATIFGALAISLSVTLFAYSLTLRTQPDWEALCLVYDIGMFFNLPSSTVHPLLFLHRAGKLPGCSHSDG